MNNGSLWVAAGAGGNTLATSTNGVSWTGLGTSVFSTQCNKLYWNGSLWMAVGSGTNSIAYSANGTSWTGVSTANSRMSGGNGIAFGNGTWIAVGGSTGNTISTSTDSGVTWTGQSGTFTTTGFGVAGPATYDVSTVTVDTIIGVYDYGVYTTVDNINFNKFQYGTGSIQYGSVAFGNNLYIATVGTSTPSTSGNTMLYSSNNGVSWTGIRPFEHYSTCAAFANNLWVATGKNFNTSGNTIITSTNGTSWTSRSSYFTIAHHVAFGNNLWVASGHGNFKKIITSPDGTTWTPRDISGSTAQYGILYRNNIWVAIGDGISTSPDGINWSSRVPNMTFQTSIAYGKDGSGNNIFVVCGQTGNSVVTSSDGITWTGRSNAFQNNTFSVVYANNKWVVFGYSNASQGFITSTDGYNWSNFTSLSLSFTMISSLSNISSQTYTKPTFVAVGQGGNTIVGSTNGLSWSSGPYQTPFTTAGYGVAWNGSQWVAVGSGGNTIAYSANGLQWTGIGTTALTTDGRSVKWINNKWFATGTSANSIVQSTNGITWTGVVTATNSFSAGYGIDYSSSVTINKPTVIAAGVGGSNLYGTTDGGNTWTGPLNTVFSTGAFNVAYNGYQWVAVGSGGNTIASSDDGLTWTGRGASIITSAGYSIRWTNGRWIAGGQGGNTLAFSSDGVTWTAGNVSVVGGLWGMFDLSMTYTKPAYIALGDGQTINVSTDASGWNALLTPRVFTTSGFAVASAETYTSPTVTARLAVAGGSGGNTMALLTI